MTDKVTIPALLQMKRFANLNHIRKPATTGILGHNASPSADRGTIGEAVGSPPAVVREPGARVMPSEPGARTGGLPAGGAAATGGGRGSGLDGDIAMAVLER